MIERIKDLDKLILQNKILHFEKEIEPYKFNNLSCKEKKNIKIITTYHKPYILWQNDIMLPIHGGRIIKSNEVIKTSQQEGRKIDKNALNWLYNNMLGDDTGDNISHLNRRWGEMTTIYWFWKNYKELDKLDYVGVMQMKKLFPYNVIENLYDYDIVCDKINKYNVGDNIDVYDKETDRFIKVKSPSKDYCVTIEKHFYNNHIINFADTYKYTMEIIKEIKPAEFNEIENFFKSSENIWCILFIMKKEIFIEYCEWIYPVLFKLEEKLSKDEKRFPLGVINTRDVAFMGERLTGYFLLKKKKEGKMINHQSFIKLPIS